jgi:hypothetical protein
MKDRKYNDQKERGHTNIQKHSQKTMDPATRTPLKPGGELRYSGRVSGSCSISVTRRDTLATSPVVSHAGVL